MVRTHALMEGLSANLGDFLHSIHSELTRPQKKFLRDGLVGLIRAGRPIVCRMARKLPDRRTRFLSRRDRLEANLNRPSDIDQKITAALPELWLPMVRQNTPIILDLSDIAKPLASLEGTIGQGAVVCLCRQWAPLAQDVDADRCGRATAAALCREKATGSRDWPQPG